MRKRQGPSTGRLADRGRAAAEQHPGPRADAGWLPLGWHVRGTGALRRGALHRLRAGEHARPPPDRFIWTLAVARDGTLWIGTQSGLVSMRGGTFSRVTPPEGTPLRDLRALLPARDGSLWIATANDGLLRLSQGRFQVLTGPPLANTLARVLSLTVDGEGALWAGTQDGTVYQIREGVMRPVPEASLPEAPISVLFVDRPGA